MLKEGVSYTVYLLDGINFTNTFKQEGTIAGQPVLFFSNEGQGIPLDQSVEQHAFVSKILTIQRKIDNA